MTAGGAPARRASPFALSGLFVCSIGLIGGLLTKPSAWTASLVRPAWHPPAWVFGPVWAVIGICAIFAYASAWRSLRTEGAKETFVALAAINAVFNGAWSALFFAAHRPDLALADIVVLWFSIVLLMAFLAARGAGRAAALLAPYLVWVAIAALLNFEIVTLNAPFASP